jgi:hypothetical protein
MSFSDAAVCQDEIAHAPLTAPPFIEDDLNELARLGPLSVTPRDNGRLAFGITKNIVSLLNAVGATLAD